MHEHCDLVMKGGVTSGVIYPRLIATLSGHYVFRNIGGTSAGAIAAAACAAAEHCRRTTGSASGFETLAQLPELLGESPPGMNRTRLLGLFQPEPGLRRHFELLLRASDWPLRVSGRVVPAVLAGLIAQYPGLVALNYFLCTALLWPFVDALSNDLPLHARVLAAIGVILLVESFSIRAMSALQRGRQWFAWVLSVSLLASVLGAGIGLFWLTFQGKPTWLALGSALASSMGMVLVTLLVHAFILGLTAALFLNSLMRGLHRNGYGLCRGRTVPHDARPGRRRSAPRPHAPPDPTARTATEPPSTPPEGLCEWLSTYLNGLAGLPPDGDPLTFGQLWGSTDPTAERHINLEVITSALSQQSVYSIPLRPDAPHLYYDPVEWERLFPPHILDFLARAQAAHPEGDVGLDDSREHLPGDARVLNQRGQLLRPLPRRADWPVVVAVRMSMSFPILLSAIPVYAIDYSLAAQRALAADIHAAQPAARAALPIRASRIWLSDGGVCSNLPLHLFDGLLPRHPTFAVNLKAPHPDYPTGPAPTADNRGGRIYLPNHNLGGRLRHWEDPPEGTPAGGLLGFVASLIGTMRNWHDEILFPYPGFRDRIVQISLTAQEGGLNLEMPQGVIGALSEAGDMAAQRLIDRFHPSGAQAGAGWTEHQVTRLGTFLGTLQPASTTLAAQINRGVWHPRLEHIRGYAPSQQVLAEQYLAGLGRIGALSAGTHASLRSGALNPLAEVRITPRL